MASLDTDKQIDKHLKTVKSRGDNTSLELASEDNGARIKGDLEVTGKYTGLHVQEEDYYVFLKNEGVSAFEFNLAGLLTMPQYGEQSNYFRIGVGNNANTTFSVVEGAGSSGGHLTLIPDGDLILDPDSQKVIINATDKLFFDGGTDTYIHEASADKVELVVGGDEMLTLDEANQRVTIEADKLVYKTEGGTVKEFSPTDSAYAGMILGYTRIQNTGSGTFDSILSLTTSMTVLQTAAGTNVGVTFVAPPSGNVEIIFTCNLYTSSTTVGFALSDNTTFNEIDPDYTYDMGSYRMDETDTNTISINWAVTGLTAGTSYTYYIAGEEISGSTATIYHGDRRGTGEHYPPITVKAIALPTTITTGS